MSDIYTAMLEVAEAVGYVQKKGRNTAQSYNYAGEADFIEAMRPALLKAGICPPHVIDITDSQVTVIDKGLNEKTGDRKNTIHVSRIYTFRYYHAASKTFVDVKAAGEGNDSLDKASYKAATGALKYALRQTFLIETGNDPEEDIKPEPKAPKAPKVEPTPEEKRENAFKWVNSYLVSVKECGDLGALTITESNAIQHKERIREAYPDYYAMIIETENEQAKKLGKV